VEAVSSLRLLPRRGEELIATWLGEDRENWTVFLLTLAVPWQERPGIWSAQTPE
jgi:hypothetical protein